MKTTKISKYYIAWILIFAVAAGTLLVPATAETVAAEETSIQQVDLQDGVLTIDGVGVVNAEIVKNINLQDIRKIEFGKTVKRVADNTFGNCYNLENVIWGGVTTIGSYAFANCEKLDMMSMSQSYVSIGEGAFWNCDSIEFIVLPVVIEKLEKNAFPLTTDIVWRNRDDSDGCAAVTDEFWEGRTGTMFVQDTEAWTAVIEKEQQEGMQWEKRQDYTDPIIYGIQQGEEGITQGYAVDLGGNFNVNRLDASGKMTISNIYPGNDLDKLYVEIRDEFDKAAITQIEVKEDAIFDVSFKQCVNLTHVDVDAQNVEIGENVFQDMEKLQTVKISGQVNLKANNFSGCKSLENLELESCQTIGQKAFYDCTSLEKINIPGGVTYIEKSAFEGCKKLTEVRIGYKVVDIRERAFYGCENLQSVEFPSFLRKIQQDAFGECPLIQSVVLPETISYIGLGNFTKSDIYWKGTEVTIQQPEEGASSFFEQMTGTMYVPAGTFWSAQQETYPETDWKSWTPVIEQAQTETYDLMEQLAFKENSSIPVESCVDEDGVPCTQIHFQKKYERVAFEIPEGIRVQDYAAVSIKAKVGGQLMIDLWADDIDASDGVVGGTNVVDCTYPFYYKDDEGETKYGTEDVVLTNEQISDRGMAAKYISIGTCRGPEEVEPFQRKYEFYIYSVTFHPVSPKTKKLVFESVKANTPAPTASPAPEPSAAPTASPTPEPSGTPAANPTLEPSAAPTVNPTPQVSTAPVVVPTQPAAPPQTPAAATTEKPAFTPEPVGKPHFVKKIKRPTLSLRKRGQGKHRYIQLTVKSSTGKYFELYMKKKGRKYVRIRLKKTSLKKGRQVVRLAYSQKGYLVWFKARVYEKGKKKNGVYSREKKIRL